MLPNPYHAQSQKSGAQPNPSSTIKPLCWIEVPVSDINASTERLEKLLGWTVAEPRTNAFALLVTGNKDPIGVSLVLRESPAGANDQPVTTLIGANIGQEAIETVYGRAMTLGFMPVEPPHAVPAAGHGMRAVIRDPDGNLIGLWRD